MGDTSHARAQKAAKDAVLADLRSGTITITEALSADLTCISNATLWAVLTTAHGMGPAGARKVCLESGVFPQTKIGELSDLHRQLVINALPKRAL